MAKIIGIDNGVSGAMVAADFSSDEPKILEAVHYPADNIADIHNFFVRHADAAFAAVESPIRTFGFNRTKDSSSFRTYGEYLAYLEIADFDYISASPANASWQRRTGFKQKGRANLKPEAVELSKETYSNALDFIEYSRMQLVPKLDAEGKTILKDNGKPLQHRVPVKDFDYDIADACMLAKFAYQQWQNTRNTND